MRRRTLRTVSFYIGDGAIPREPFRVRLYQVAANGPGAELPPDMLQVFAPQSNAWVTVNLDDYRVAVPEKGYFVAVEFLVGGSMRPSETASLLSAYTPIGPVMRPVYAAHAQNAWRYVIGSGWMQLPWHNGVFARYGAMIKLEVAPICVSLLNYDCRTARFRSSNDETQTGASTPPTPSAHDSLPRRR